MGPVENQTSTETIMQVPRVNVKGDLRGVHGFIPETKFKKRVKNNNFIFQSTSTSIKETKTRLQQ